MQEETKLWLKYSQENFKAAKVLLESQLFNPCLQNIQQSIEKALKSLFIEHKIQFKKTHNILELKSILESKKILVELSEDECDFLDSIYLPSKYPLGSALPYFEPDEKICNNSLLLAKRVIREVEILLK
ncbi:MAG: HEPN domain-containing protein [Ignavibacteriales bacterium]|nr:HEPN domain-containing protein [Ignavibacteriales bacterium]MCB9258670.1 HEPN domain-containing protein [Ignavibacteriales bacterium]